MTLVIGVIEYPVADEADLTAAVIGVGRWGEEAGCGGVLKSKIMTIVSELGRNILKYAGTGRIRCDHTRGQENRGVEIVVTDQGPGIEDVDAALSDHYSTSGTLGLGLPGVRRMVDEFDLQSEPGGGTTVTVRLWIDES